MFHTLAHIMIIIGILVLIIPSIMVLFAQHSPLSALRLLSASDPTTFTSTRTTFPNSHNKFEGFRTTQRNNPVMVHTVFKSNQELIKQYLEQRLITSPLNYDNHTTTSDTQTSMSNTSPSDYNPFFSQDFTPKNTQPIAPRKYEEIVQLIGHLPLSSDSKKIPLPINRTEFYRTHPAQYPYSILPLLQPTSNIIQRSYLETQSQSQSPTTTPNPQKTANSHSQNPVLLGNPEESFGERFSYSDIRSTKLTFQSQDPNSPTVLPNNDNHDGGSHRSSPGSQSSQRPKYQWRCAPRRYLEPLYTKTITFPDTVPCINSLSSFDCNCVTKEALRAVLCFDILTGEYVPDPFLCQHWVGPIPHGKYALFNGVCAEKCAEYVYLCPVGSSSSSDEDQGHSDDNEIQQRDAVVPCKISVCEQSIATRGRCYTQEQKDMIVQHTILDNKKYQSNSGKKTKTQQKKTDHFTHTDEGDSYDHNDEFSTSSSFFPNRTFTSHENDEDSTHRILMHKFQQNAQKLHNTPKPMPETSLKSQIPTNSAYLNPFKDTHPTLTTYPPLVSYVPFRPRCYRRAQRKNLHDVLAAVRDEYNFMKTEPQGTKNAFISSLNARSALDLLYSSSYGKINDTDGSNLPNNRRLSSMSQLYYRKVPESYCEEAGAALETAIGHCDLALCDIAPQMDNIHVFSFQTINNAVSGIEGTVSGVVQPSIIVEERLVQMKQYFNEVTGSTQPLPKSSQNGHLTSDTSEFNSLYENNSSRFTTFASQPQSHLDNSTEPLFAQTTSEATPLLSPRSPSPQLLISSLQTFQYIQISWAHANLHPGLMISIELVPLPRTNYTPPPDIITNPMQFFAEEAGRPQIASESNQKSSSVLKSRSFLRNHFKNASNSEHLDQEKDFYADLPLEFGIFRVLAERNKHLSPSEFQHVLAIQDDAQLRDVFDMLRELNKGLIDGKASSVLLGTAIMNSQQVFLQIPAVTTQFEYFLRFTLLPVINTASVDSNLLHTVEESFEYRKLFFAKKWQRIKELTVQTKFNFTSIYNQLSYRWASESYRLNCGCARGRCNGEFGSCVCPHGFFGESCDQRVCDNPYKVCEYPISPYDTFEENILYYQQTPQILLRDYTSNFTTITNRTALEQNGVDIDKLRACTDDWFVSETVFPRKAILPKSSITSQYSSTTSFPYSPFEQSALFTSNNTSEEHLSFLEDVLTSRTTALDFFISDYRHFCYSPINVDNNVRNDLTISGTGRCVILENPINHQYHPKCECLHGFYGPRCQFYSMCDNAQCGSSGVTQDNTSGVYIHPDHFKKGVNVLNLKKLCYSHGVDKPLRADDSMNSENAENIPKNRHIMLEHKNGENTTDIPQFYADGTPIRPIFPTTPTSPQVLRYYTLFSSFIYTPLSRSFSAAALALPPPGSSAAPPLHQHCSCPSNMALDSTGRCVCQLECVRGTARSDCSRCACPINFGGTRCECKMGYVRIVFAGLLQTNQHLARNSAKYNVLKRMVSRFDVMSFLNEQLRKSGQTINHDTSPQPMFSADSLGASPFSQAGEDFSPYNFPSEFYNNSGRAERDSIETFQKMEDHRVSTLSKKSKDDNDGYIDDQTNSASQFLSSLRNNMSQSDYAEHIANLTRLHSRRSRKNTPDNNNTLNFSIPSSSRHLHYHTETFNNTDTMKLNRILHETTSKSLYAWKRLFIQHIQSITGLPFHIMDIYDVYTFIDPKENLPKTTITLEFLLECPHVEAIQPTVPLSNSTTSPSSPPFSTLNLHKTEPSSKLFDPSNCQANNQTTHHNNSDHLNCERSHDNLISQELAMSPVPQHNPSPYSPDLVLTPNTMSPALARQLFPKHHLSISPSQWNDFLEDLAASRIKPFILSPVSTRLMAMIEIMDVSAFKRDPFSVVLSSRPIEQQIYRFDFNNENTIPSSQSFTDCKEYYYQFTPNRCKPMYRAFQYDVKQNDIFLQWLRFQLLYQKIKNEPLLSKFFNTLIIPHQLPLSFPETQPTTPDAGQIQATVSKNDNINFNYQSDMGRSVSFLNNLDDQQKLFISQIFKAYMTSIDGVGMNDPIHTDEIEHNFKYVVEHQQILAMISALSYTHSDYLADFDCYEQHSITLGNSSQVPQEFLAAYHIRSNTGQNASSDNTSATIRITHLVPCSVLPSISFSYMYAQCSKTNPFCPTGIDIVSTLNIFTPSTDHFTAALSDRTNQNNVIEIHLETGGKKNQVALWEILVPTIICIVFVILIILFALALRWGMNRRYQERFDRDPNFSNVGVPFGVAGANTVPIHKQFIAPGPTGDDDEKDGSDTSMVHHSGKSGESSAENGTNNNRDGIFSWLLSKITVRTPDTSEDNFSNRSNSDRNLTSPLPHIELMQLHNFGHDTTHNSQLYQDQAKISQSAGSAGNSASNVNKTRAQQRIEGSVGDIEKKNRIKISKSFQASPNDTQIEQNNKQHTKLQKSRKSHQSPQNTTANKSIELTSIEPNTLQNKTPIQKTFPELLMVSNSIQQRTRKQPVSSTLISNPPTTNITTQTTPHPAADLVNQPSIQLLVSLASSADATTSRSVPISNNPSQTREEQPGESQQQQQESYPNTAALSTGISVVSRSSQPYPDSGSSSFIEIKKQDTRHSTPTAFTTIIPEINTPDRGADLSPHLYSHRKDEMYDIDEKEAVSLHDDDDDEPLDHTSSFSHFHKKQ